MKNILIVGQRKEIAMLFEMLMQQRNRQFVSARSLVQCLDLAARTLPALIIIDCELAEAKVCRETVSTLKSAPGTSEIPIFLIDDPEQCNPDASQLKSLADGIFSEPFSPTEIKMIAGKHL